MSKIEFWENITIFCAKKNIFLSFGDLFIFSNACANQINLGTNYLLKKFVLEKMGYWQKESEFGKNVICFKAPLGSLGLKRQLINKRMFVIFKKAMCLNFLY